MQDLLARVVGRESKQAVGALERPVDAEMRDCLDQDFGVGGAAPVHAELGGHFGAVIELAIIGQHEATVGREHRLIASWREVDDREPPVSERDASAGVDPVTVAVWPTMRDRSRHGARGRRQLRFGTPIKSPQAGNPTHADACIARARANRKGYEIIAQHQ